MKKTMVMLLAGVFLTFSVTACSKETPVAEEVVEQESKEEEVIEEEPEVVEEEPEEEVVEEDDKEVKTVNKGNIPDFGELSDDIYSFQLQIGEDVYQFPMRYEDFVAYGWESKDDDTQQLDANYRTSVWSMTMGDLECYAEVMNFDINARPIHDCYIGGVKFDQFLAKNSDSKIILPKGIELNAASLEDIKEAYGTPSYENTLDSGRTTIKYERDSYERVEMVIDGESKVLTSIDVRNLAMPDDFEMGEISDEVPEIAQKYTTPKSISSDLADYTFELGGDLYVLPGLVSQFVDNGWEIMDGNAEAILEGRGYGRIQLMKDNQKMSVGIMNYSEGATSVMNCFLIAVESDGISMSISGNISLGTTKEKVEESIADVEYEQQEGSSYICYDITPTGKKTEGYEVYVNKDSNEVYKIKINYQPKYADYTGS